MKDIYERRGVSSSKEDVHKAVSKLYKGIFPGAFCKILPDFFGGDETRCIVLHGDGAGTKSSLAYAYWRETGDISVFKGIAQDALVMNLDDLLCVGITTEPIIYSSTIGRNKNLIPGEVIAAVIDGNEEFCNNLFPYGITMHLGGGETADVGDLVRTLIVDATMVVSAKREDIIVPNIQAGDVIVGLSSLGESKYENVKNSSMGSNGLTSGRHDMFSKIVGQKYPETYDPLMDESLVYCGSHNLTDPSPLAGFDYGKLVLSPTRTYAPIFVSLFKQIKKTDVHAIIHCSGGGQTKVLGFLNENVKIIKDNLYPTPVLFSEIQKASNTSWREMYKNFNMGHRMEVYCSRDIAYSVMSVASQFNVDARIVGKCVNRNSENALTIIKDLDMYEY